MKKNLGFIFASASILFQAACGDIVLPNSDENNPTTIQDNQKPTKDQTVNDEQKNTQEIPTIENGNDTVTSDDKSTNNPAQNNQSAESIFEMSVAGKWEQCDLLDYGDVLVSRLWVLTLDAAGKKMNFKYTDFEGGNCKGTAIGSDTLLFSYSLKKESDNVYLLDLSLSNVMIYTRIAKVNDTILISLGSMNTPENNGDTQETRCDIDDQMIGFTMTRVIEK